MPHLPEHDPDIPAAERELLAVIDELKAKRQRLDTNDAQRHELQLAIYEYSQQVIHMRRNRMRRERGRSWLMWALAATLYSPPFAVLLLIAFPMRER